MKLEIKEPCHEDWNNMKIGVQSRHCEVCVKSVMDFTNSSRAEIITYILSNPNDSVCGRLRKDQFDFQHEDVPVLVNVLKSQPRNHAFLILALVSMTLSACAQEPPKTIKTPPAVNNQHMLGKVAPTAPSDSTTKPIICDPIETTKGEVILMGDIAEPIPPPQPPILGALVAEYPEIEDKGILQFSEKMPEFEGGIDALFKYVNDYFKPNKLKEKGSIYVRFVVNADGTLSNPEILNIPANLSYLQADVIRMVEKMPNWIPGENGGKKVNVYYTIPVRFQ